MRELPDNLVSTHRFEENNRAESLRLISNNSGNCLHLKMSEQAMNLADLFRQLEMNDENIRAVQLLGIRVFNSFAASIKLCLSGYYQTSVYVLRDIMETTFLIDLFNKDRSLIEMWRNADDKTRKREFSPDAVRKKLDKRDGYTTKKRKLKYDLFSQLASHPTNILDYLLHPEKNGDAMIGPFVSKQKLDAILFEIGQMAVEFGIHFRSFFPNNWSEGCAARHSFHAVSTEWIHTFRPHVLTIK